MSDKCRRTRPGMCAVYTTSRSSQLGLDGNAGDRGGLSDVLTGCEHTVAAGNALKAADAQQIQIVDWDGYQRINQNEIAHGELKGKPREKIVDVGQMLEIAKFRD